MSAVRTASRSAVRASPAMKARTQSKVRSVGDRPRLCLSTKLGSPSACRPNRCALVGGDVEPGLNLAQEARPHRLLAHEGQHLVGGLQAHVRALVKTAEKRPIVDGVPAEAVARQLLARDAHLDGIDKDLAATANVRLADRYGSHGEKVLGLK